VTWYAAGELHLEKVVVELPGIDAFADWDGGVAVRLTDGRLLMVRPDGSVVDLDEEPPPLADPPEAPPYEGGPYDVVVQSVPRPGGGWAHLLDSSRRTAQRDEVRSSETGRRALVLCTESGQCGLPRTIQEGTVTIRLR
jgi:hypothetical protein